MVDSQERKAITLQLFAATGETIPEDDPIVTGAILFSHMLNEVARLSADEIKLAGQHAAVAIHEAAQHATLVMNEASQRCVAETAAAAKVASSQSKRLDAEVIQAIKKIEAELLKAVKIASRSHGSTVTLRYIPAWYAVIGALAVGLALATAWVVGVEQGATLAEEAAIGRSFTRVVPTMDPKLKAQLMEHVRKNPG